MKNQRCPKCGQKANPKGENSTVYQCLSADIARVGFVQSPHCKERVKVAKLKRQVAKLKQRERASLPESKPYIFNGTAGELTDHLCSSPGCEVVMKMGDRSYLLRGPIKFPETKIG